MITVAAPAGVRGVDTNAVLSSRDASAFFAHGYRFALRYLPRVVAGPNDLTGVELLRLQAAGFAVMPVQHVESESSWAPSASKGTAYGQVAAQSAMAAGIPRGTTVWCDLEGVWTGASPLDVIADCHDWYNAVSSAGYLPGLYVGWHAGLGAVQLYHSLPFAQYWAAYNLNADQCPAVRGVCMRQHAATAEDRPPGVTLNFDTDVIVPDAFGNCPTVAAPDGWVDCCRAVIA